MDSKKRRFAVAVLSITAFVVACDPRAVGSVMIDAGEAMSGDGSAEAQESTCTQWRIVELDTGVNYDAWTLVDYTLPVDHEPLEMDHAYVGSSENDRVTVIARTCAN